MSLYAAVFGLDQVEACRQLAGELGLSAPAGALVPALARQDHWESILPAPVQPPERIEHPSLGQPSVTWTYRSVEGRLLFLG